MNKYKIKAKTKGQNPVVMEFTVSAENLGDAKEQAYKQLKAEGMAYSVVTNITKM